MKPKQELNVSNFLPFPKDNYNPNLKMGDKVRMIKLGGDHLEGKSPRTSRITWILGNRYVYK
jgi:hypothetical protein